MNVYERFVYSPLQKYFSPLILRIPRHIILAGRSVTVFTANGVTLGRTILVVPVALCLKLVSFISLLGFCNCFFTSRFRYNVSACMLIVLHDFLDHVDGIVAKVHRRHYGMVDSPILGSFLDAFCDKVSVTTQCNKQQKAIIL